jgi:hypothetical protein
VNRGIDEAVQGLERLKRAKDFGLDPACFDEKVTLFEIHRASLNEYLCNILGSNEDLDSARFERKYRKYEKNSLDEVQVYRDLLAVEDRRRVEGKPPMVRFLTEAEQQEWERQYPTPPEDADSEAPFGAGGGSREPPRPAPTHRAETAPQDRDLWTRTHGEHTVPTLVMKTENGRMASSNQRSGQSSGSF